MTTESKYNAAVRHELKHRISPAEDLVLAQRLRKLFPHDKNAGPDGNYRVTSLYFDTPYDRAYREKMSGVDRREKFRLRYYGTDTSFIRLEKKFKINGLCGKRKVRLEKEKVKLLLTGDYDFMADSGEPLLVEFYSKLKRGMEPKTIVCYDREAFCYAPGNVRVTLDRNLRTGLSSVDFFNTDLYHVSVMDPPCTVLEVKFDRFLPETVRMAVQVPDRRAEACSKYVLCRRFD